MRCDWAKVKNDRIFDGDGKRVEQYYGFGEDVLAVADGTVVSVHDGMTDADAVCRHDPEVEVGLWRQQRHAGNRSECLRLVRAFPAATGRKMRFTGTTVLKVIDGKIAEEVGLDDGVTALTQLGLLKAAWIKPATVRVGNLSRNAGRCGARLFLCPHKKGFGPGAGSKRSNRAIKLNSSIG